MHLNYFHRMFQRKRQMRLGSYANDSEPVRIEAWCSRVQRPRHPLDQLASLAGSKPASRELTPLGLLLFSPIQCWSHQRSSENFAHLLSGYRWLGPRTDPALVESRRPSFAATIQEHTTRPVGFYVAPQKSHAGAEHRQTPGHFIAPVPKHDGGRRARGHEDARPQHHGTLGSLGVGDGAALFANKVICSPVLEPASTPGPLGSQLHPPFPWTKECCIRCDQTQPTPELVPISALLLPIRPNHENHPPPFSLLLEYWRSKSKMPFHYYTPLQFWRQNFIRMKISVKRLLLVNISWTHMTQKHIFDFLPSQENIRNFYLSKKHYFAKNKTPKSSAICEKKTLFIIPRALYPLVFLFFFSIPKLHSLWIGVQNCPRIKSGSQIFSRWKGLFPHYFPFEEKRIKIKTTDCDCFYIRMLIKRSQDDELAQWQNKQNSYYV